MPIDPEGALAFEDQKGGLKKETDEKDDPAEKEPAEADPASEDNDEEPPLSFPTEELKHFEKKNNLDLLNSIIPSAETVMTDTLVSEAAHRPLVGPSDMMSVFFNHRLAPLCDTSIRGIVFAPDASDAQIGNLYSTMVRQLLIDLARVFGPREIEEKSQVPSFIITQLHPDAPDDVFVERAGQKIPYADRYPGHA